MMNHININSTTNSKSGLDRDAAEAKWKAMMADNSIYKKKVKAVNRKGEDIGEARPSQ